MVPVSAVPVEEVEERAGEEQDERQGAEEVRAVLRQKEEPRDGKERDEDDRGSCR